jgi:hypothetical protein
LGVAKLNQSILYLLYGRIIKCETISLFLKQLTIDIERLRSIGVLLSRASFRFEHFETGSTDCCIGRWEEMVMVPVKSCHRGLISLLLCCLVVVLTGTAVYGAKERDKTQANEYRTTQIELQSELMSFSDRFGAILGQAVIDVEAQTPNPEIRLLA